MKAISLHAPKGHPWITENIKVFSDGRRTCTICLAESRARARAAHKARKGQG